MIPNDVGIVVIGRNEGERLIGCLSSVKSHEGTVVYVDSGSSDGSIAAAEELGASVVKLDLSRPFTAARARNEGFAALKALRPDVRFVQFIDGDCILVSGWLDKALVFLNQRPNAALACGRRREHEPSASIYNLLCDLEWDTPIGQTLACGGDALVRASAFEEVGGFRPQLIAGEEPELCVRLREKSWEIWRIDAEMTRHDAAMMKFGQWWVRTVRGGYAFAEVSRLHRASPFGIWKRQTVRAVFWGGLLPLTICLSALIHPVALAGTLAYGLQICRIAFAQGPTSSESWSYALFVTLGKFAEFEGILKFYQQQWSRRVVTLIEYK